MRGDVEREQMSRQGNAGGEWAWQVQARSLSAIERHRCSLKCPFTAVQSARASLRWQQRGQRPDRQPPIRHGPAAPADTSAPRSAELPTPRPTRCKALVACCSPLSLPVSPIPIPLSSLAHSSHGLSCPALTPRPRTPHPSTHLPRCPCCPPSRTPRPQPSHTPLPPVAHLVTGSCTRYLACTPSRKRRPITTPMTTTTTARVPPSRGLRGGGGADV